MDDAGRVRDVHHMRMNRFAQDNKVPGDLQLTMDQTFAELQPNGKRTMDEMGKGNIPIEGAENKRGITVVLTSSKGDTDKGDAGLDLHRTNVFCTAIILHRWIFCTGGTNATI